jgi:hypothetical protein
MRLGRLHENLSMGNRLGAPQLILAMALRVRGNSYFPFHALEADIIRRWTRRGRGWFCRSARTGVLRLPAIFLLRTHPWKLRHYPKTDIIDISRRCGLNNLRGCKVGLQVRLPLIFNSLSFQRSLMSAPSRRPEIRRRRTRNEKIAKLRKRLSAAQSDADKTRITAKLHRMSIGSPGEPLLK